MLETLIPANNVSVHFLGNEALLFDQRRQMLYAANPGAAIIWCCLDDGMSTDDITALLVQRHAVSPLMARRYVDDVMVQRNRMHEAEAGSQTETLASPDRGAGPPRHASPQPAAVRHYRLLDSIFAVRFSTEDLRQRVDHLLAHLCADAVVAAHSTFDLVEEGGGFAILEDGKTLEAGDNMNAVAAATKACLVYRALELSKDFSAVHAAAVRRKDGERCLLIPGNSGRGKSTLVAGMVAEGFELMGDDTAVLTDVGLAVRPMPCGICVKPGSWDLLSVRFPRLPDAHIHDRPDGHRVRYLLPPEYAVAHADSRTPVGWIVFPDYQAKGPTELHRIGSSAAVQRLMAGFLPLRGGLQESEVERLVRWIADVPCYDLRLSSLNQAVVLLGQLCR